MILSDSIPGLNYLSNLSVQLWTFLEWVDIDRRKK